MRDFDEARRERAERDRTFVIGGETFVMRTGVRPEVLAEYETISIETSSAETLEVVDRLVLQMIEPDDDAHERWAALRAREVDPITVADLQALTEWLVGEQTGRPTQLPEPSAGGRGRTGTRSTGGSSSPGGRTAPAALASVS